MSATGVPPETGHATTPRAGLAKHPRTRENLNDGPTMSTRKVVALTVGGSCKHRH